MKIRLLTMSVLFVAFFVGAVETSLAQSDAQLLASTATDLRKSLPVKVGDVELTTVITYCQSGCEQTYSASYLALQGWTPNLTQSNVNFPQIQQSLRSRFLQDYCVDPIRQKNINLAIYVSDMNKTFIGTTAINPTDCPANVIPTPTPQQNSANAQFLNQWAVDTKAKFPLTVGSVQFTNAASVCLFGCTIKDNSDYLMIMAKTPSLTAQTTTIGQIEQSLKPTLLGEYCSNPGKSRNINLGVNVDDMNSQRIGNFWVRPSDCNVAVAPTPTPIPVNPPTTGNSVEDQFWDAVKNSSRAQDFQSYLTTYPNGKYAAIARTKLSPKTGAPTTSGSLTDVQFLNNWAAQTKVGLPEELGEFQLAKAWSRCPNGCEERDSSPYLLLMFNARGYQQTAPMTQLEAKLKPILLVEYCKSEAVQRKINVGVFFQDRGQNVGYNNFWIEPKDCAANTSQNTNLAPGKTATHSGDNGFPFKAADVMLQLVNPKDPSAILSLAEVKVFGTN